MKINEIRDTIYNFAVEHIPCFKSLKEEQEQESNKFLDELMEEIKSKKTVSSRKNETALHLFLFSVVTEKIHFDSILCGDVL